MFIQEKSKTFAVRIIRFYNYLKESNQHTLGKQVLRSGTSIGANVSEATNAQSDRDFLLKLNIALKECSETKYWLEILYESDIVDKAVFDSIYPDCVELEKLLTCAVKTTKAKL
ncbi:MAG: four helix bundle protein [Alistipes sp.]|nr:four helix bundle protein [Alistipes sp.]MDE5692119.1 four helix bundle protein [Alistipes sp.]MDE7077851.1 four helix bundle protein [Alistipes sp.]